MPVQERRQFFRIDDTIHFEYKVIEPNNPCSDYSISNELLGENNQKYLEASQYFQTIDYELAELDKSISLIDPALAQYLNLMNSKIDFLTRQMLMSNNIQLRKVNLSLGGMSFKTNELIRNNSKIKLIIYTKPKMIPVIIDATVLSGELHDDEEYKTTVCFNKLTHEQEQLLSQHILLAQIKNRSD